MAELADALDLGSSEQSWEFESLCPYQNLISVIYGEVSEWLKELVLKTSDAETHRGFESHPLRQYN